MEEFPAGLRPAHRPPAQPRGERRVEAILGAAAQLIAEEGLDALTMSAVAERSGSATGSLYHFFPDRAALETALVERIVAGIRGLLPVVFSARLRRGSVQSFVHELVAPIADFAGQHPEVPALMGRLRARTTAIDVEIAARLREAVSPRAFDLDDAARELIVRMMMGIIRAGIQQIAESPASVHPAVQRELEIALSGYLAQRLR